MKSKSLLPDLIVLLDSGTLDFGDLPLTALQKLGHFKAYPFTRPAEVARRIAKARQVIVNKCVLNAETLKHARFLKAVHVAATGVNNVDLQAAREAGIRVTNVAGYSTESVVQLTFSFLLAAAVNLLKYDQALHGGAWSQSRFFMWPRFPVSEIHGKTLGVIGCGTIGRRVCEVGGAFGLKILTCRIPGRTYPAKDTRRVSLSRLLKESDYLTIHAPLTPLTRDLIGERELRTMKRSACLINMARGGIVNEKALLKALKKKWIANAATDVLVQEPPRADEPLLKLPNLIAMPHMGWASLESRRRLIGEVARNIEAFRSGKKRNCVV